VREARAAMSGRAGGGRRGRAGLVFLVLLGAGSTAFASIEPVAYGSATAIVGGTRSAVRPGAERAGVTTKIAWRSCGVRLECGRVRVPLDWAHPGRGTIALPVIRHLASQPGRRIGTLFVNAGGATGSVAAVRAEGDTLDALGGGRFDVVGWALRGTAGSRVVRCFDDARRRAAFWGGRPIPTTASQGRAYLPKTVAFPRGCQHHSGDLLAHVSTTDDARDLDRLRRLVGDRALTYRAVSYGTFLGQTYANLFPGRVRAMALDGLVDPRTVVRGAEARFADTVVAMDPGLDRFEARCQAAGPARCALAGQGPVAARVARLLRRLRLAPIPAPDAAPPGALQYSDVLTALFVTLTNPSAWPQLAIDLDQAAGGDGSALATQARAVLAGVRSAAGEPSAAITCTDSPARQGAGAWQGVIGRLTKVSAIGGPFVGWANWAPCASWPARSADRYTGPWDAATSNPVLVIGTRFDPATPFANARRVARLLPRAVLLTHDGYGHTSEADPSACIQRTTRAYLVRLVAPPRGTICPSDRQPFDPDFGTSPP
jgi:pimeloyl-ACP methyl ester carboxylesterase